ncbi:zinc finger domain-containing protein [Amycolatopsis nalaikhensis]|uniref:DNA-binding phage zinc finger domain-containing protein n=1 Tax=Amycolatopsis nalaikhensis TaxID=715472 RepID=A0ABY8XZA2_9PSEU|nr:hypothetical protein [Amycolatopsis sp. 2-2]WIV60732.1 hypothetical protein QP939_20015 [Amycolatopsis sp. 2-2]
MYNATMVRSRGRRRFKGLVGTPMGGPGNRRRSPAAQRNDLACPDCFSVPGQPCRTITSAPGASVLKLGKVQPTMHTSRASSTTATSKKPMSAKPPPRRPPKTVEPVDISKIDPDRAAFVPRNQRPNAELGRTDRLGQDALPRGQRRDTTPRNFY